MGVDPSAGITLTHTHGGCGGGQPGKKGLAVVGLSGDGSSLAVFPAAADPPLAARVALPSDVRGATGAASSVTDLAGTGGAVLELGQRGGGSVAISLTSSGKSGGACAVAGLEGGAKEARLCAGATAGGKGCALAGGMSVSGKTFVASASMVDGGERECLGRGLGVSRLCVCGKSGALFKRGPKTCIHVCGWSRRFVSRPVGVGQTRAEQPTHSLHCTLRLERT